jgi:DNA-binding CsgD family transcriptional regulator
METRGRAAGRPGRQLAWPFTGREEELAWIDAQRRAGGCCGVVISGPAGVGKTRLARELLAAGVRGGGASEWVQGTRAAASIPLGAFAGLVPLQAGTGDRLYLFQLCADALRQRSAAGRVLVGIDDAHLLDPASAALVLHLAASGTAFVVVTVRAGEPCHDPIVALWKDAGALRLELQQLSEDDVAGLLAAALGGEVDPGVPRWAFDASEGNALYLRELVTGALAAGALEHAGGGWRLRFRPRPGPALVDLISARLAGLTEEELDTVRLLALGEPLAVSALARIAGTAALSRLEDRGLAIVTPLRDPAAGGQARLGHPLYGEVVREMTASLRAARLRRRLAEAVQASGMEQPGDALKVVAWLDEAGAAAGPPLLLAAARAANAASDPDLAERLARRAGPAGGVDAVLVIARAHMLRRRFAEAEDLLAGLEGQLASPDLAADYLTERARLVLHLGLGRTGDAFALLARARDWFTEAGWPARVEAIELEVQTVNTGAAAEVIEAAEQVLQRDDLIPQARRRVSIAQAFSLHHAGRSAEARAATERLRPSLPLRDDDDVQAFVAWAVVRLECGWDWDEAEAWLRDAGRAAAHGDEPLTHGQMVSALGVFALRRGRPVTAARRLREAIPSLMRRDPMRRLPIAWLYLVIAEAMHGDLSAARQAEASYRALVAGATVAYQSPQEDWARAALTVAEGNTSQATAMLLDAAGRHESPTDQVLLLYQALRADADSEIVAPALAAAAAACDGPLTDAFARQAAALAASDGAALADAAGALGQIGAWLWAAEAAAQASVAHTRAGRGDSARRALALSGRFRDQCEELRSPVLAAVHLAPADLTRREREIVELASRGATNAEIAGRLVLSVRTVESHLYRAMSKLGVGTRQELRSLQASAGPADLQ